MRPTRVLIVDDNIPYRWAILEALSDYVAVEVVEEASDGIEAVEKAKALRPDVVLMDLNMPNSSGVDATRRLQEEIPETNVLINTVSERDVDLVECLKAGARGYVLKQEEPEMVAQAIQYVANGGIVVSPSMAAVLSDWLRTQTLEPTPVATTSPAQVPAMKGTQSSGGTLYATLVLSPPVEPHVILKLHQWLTNTAQAEIQTVIPSISGDTVLAMTFQEQLPLLRLLAELPFVAHVSAEPFPENDRILQGAGKAAGRAWLPFERARLRLRLTTG